MIVIENFCERFLHSNKNIIQGEYQFMTKVTA